MKEEGRRKTKKAAAPELAAIVRQTRVNLAAEEITAVCQKHNVNIIVAGFALVDGKLIPQVQVVAAA